MKNLDDPLPDGKWSHRGYLPHFDARNVTQFVTIRLADSLPGPLLDRWRREVGRLPRRDRQLAMSRRVERYLDRGIGPTHLADPRVALMIERALFHFNGERYLLHAWVIMPNHLHLALTPPADLRLGVIIGRFKSFTALEANKILRRQGPFWQPDYYDRVIRDERHFKEVVWYIHQNPVKRGLCAEASEYRWSSAWRRRSFADCL